MKQHKKILIFLGILAILSPLGIILPEYFKSGKAWGEWSKGEIKEKTGYVPEKMYEDAGKYHAPLPDYSNGKQNSLKKKSFFYIFSGILGAAIVIVISTGIIRIINRKQHDS